MRSSKIAELRFKTNQVTVIEFRSEQAEDCKDEISHSFEVAELAKSLVVVPNSRPKSGDFGYIFKSYLVIEKATASSVDFAILRSEHETPVFVAPSSVILTTHKIEWRKATRRY